MRNRADVLVIAQFVLLALLLLPGTSLWSSGWITSVALVLAATGLAISVGGLARLGRNIVPWVAPRPGAPLETGGIYRFTRNPIYLGILVGSAGWVLWRARIELLIVWTLLVVVLTLKAHIEQRYLVAAYGEDYVRYAERTPLILWGRGIR